jgi:hypothetical protein
MPAIFGDRTPPSPKWWAPFVYAAVFGVLAAFLTYGSMRSGALPDPHGAAKGMWIVIATLWAVVALGLVQGTVAAVRRRRARRG